MQSHRTFCVSRTPHVGEERVWICERPAAAKSGSRPAGVSGGAPGGEKFPCGFFGVKIPPFLQLPNGRSPPTPFLVCWAEVRGVVVVSAGLMGPAACWGEEGAGVVALGLFFPPKSVSWATEEGVPPRSPPPDLPLANLRPS